jgi:methylmalonyl-CoA mutase N-terminal domain/subunit
MTQSIEEAFTKWQKEILRDVLKRFPERRQDFQTTSDLPFDRVFLPSTTEFDYLNKLGFPGQYPYTRGVQPTMYRGRLWTMRQYAGYASAEETNRRFRYLLEQGQTGISVAFDLPTQIGYDADHALASGEVGRVGVSISCLEDMARLFDAIPLDQVSTSMTINAPAAILLAMYIAVAKRQGGDIQQLRGTIQNDILKEYIARGTYIFPPKPSMRLVTDTFQYCRDDLPHWNTISISGYHIREAGSSAVQEVAFTFANALAYVQAALDAGLEIDDFAPQLAFFFSADRNFLEEISKFRAARRLWADLMRNRFGGKNPKSWRLRFHTQTAGSSLTEQQPENNIVRVALQALSAVLGGTQSLHTNSMDEALGLPTEKAVRVALRTQQIIAYESGVANTIDPMAGSYAIETLTEKIERGVRDYLDRIDEFGGAQAAIENGFIQREIMESAFRIQQEIDHGDQIVVGVNDFKIDEKIDITPLKVDPTVEAVQHQRLAKLRAQRDAKIVKTLLNQLEKTALGDENLMPILIECVEGDVTLGEICERLRKIWGEYQAPPIL